MVGETGEVGGNKNQVANLDLFTDQFEAYWQKWQF